MKHPHEPDLKGVRMPPLEPLMVPAFIAELKSRMEVGMIDGPTRLSIFAELPPGFNVTQPQGLDTDDLLNRLRYQISYFHPSKCTEVRQGIDELLAMAQKVPGGVSDGFLAKLQNIQKALEAYESQLRQR